MLNFKRELLKMDIEDFFEMLEKAIQKNPGSVRIVLETAYQRGKWEVIVDWTETVNNQNLAALKGL